MALADRPQTSRAPGKTQSRPPERPPATPVSSEHEQRGDAGASAPDLHVNPGGVSGEDGSKSGRREEVSGARLLLSDIRVVVLLANEARYRTMEGVLGVPRDQANLVTLVALGTLLEAAHAKTEQLLKAPGPPTRADAALGAAVLKEMLYGLGGSSSRDTPVFGTLVMVGLLGGVSGPAVRRSVRGVRGASHRIRHSFNHRYGHLFSR